MPLTLNNQEIRIDTTTSISVSDITEDPDSGGFVRRVEFYQDALDVANRKPVLAVMIYGDQAGLRFTIPSGVTFVFALLAVDWPAVLSWLPIGSF